jgi:endonuclease/exonuclease/phosphatase family metal-dependent hydrolase
VIDHILINKKSRLHAVKGGIIEMKKPLSDHKPVWAELEPRRE